MRYLAKPVQFYRTKKCPKSLQILKSHLGAGGISEKNVASDDNLTVLQVSETTYLKGEKEGADLCNWKRVEFVRLKAKLTVHTYWL